MKPSANCSPRVSQFLLFGGETNPPEPPRPPPIEVNARDGLRYYQNEALDSVWEQYRSGRRRTYGVLATGTGKTQIFCALAFEMHRETKKPILVLADRTELVSQASDRMLQMFGMRSEWEKADQYASLSSPLVCASIQTISKDGRLARFPKDHFGIVICDECHHFLAKSYRKVVEHFADSNTLVFGVTATPDREDEQHLGKVFGSREECGPAYVYDIMQAVEDGFLVEPEGVALKVEAFDVSGVSSKNGDLAQGELDDVVCKAAYGVVDQIVGFISPSNRVVGFFPGVASAELAAALFNQKDTGGACCISGKTDPDERKGLVRDLKAGALRALMNCDVATEGFDWPAADVVALARPTKSRRIYAQSAGRGLRPLVDLRHLPHKHQAAERKALIAASAKPKCYLLDFVGNSGRHTLQCTIDLFAASFTEEEVRVARELAAESAAKKEKERQEGKEPRGESLSGLAALKAAREALQEQARKLRLHTSAELQRFDPFELCDSSWDEECKYSRYTTPPSAAQEKLLKDLGVTDYEIGGMSKKAASKLIEGLKERKKKGLPSLKAINFLRKYGIDATGAPGVVAARACQMAIQAFKAHRQPDWGSIRRFVDDGRRTGQVGKHEAGLVRVP